ncbi:MAG: hypothetical protein RR091_07720 [Cloacibacillus sp.]
MKLAKIKHNGTEETAFVISRGFVGLARFNEEKRAFWETDFERLINGPDLAMLNRWYMAGGRSIVENISRKFIVPAEEACVVGEIFATEDEGRA